jgi:hypothetical protein
MSGKAWTARVRERGVKGKELNKMRLEKLHNEEHHKWHSSDSEMGWKYSAIGENRNAYRVLWKKLEETTRKT